LTSADASTAPVPVQPSEIDFLNGYVGRKGAELGVPTPTNTLAQGGRLIDARSGPVHFKVGRRGADGPSLCACLRCNWGDLSRLALRPGRRFLGRRFLELLALARLVMRPRVTAMLSERPAQKELSALREYDACGEHQRRPFGSNGDVGTSRLEEQLLRERLNDPVPIQKRPIWACARRIQPSHTYSSTHLLRFRESRACTHR
jgi:hypothetical protein